MAEHVTHPSITERMERARRLFQERALAKGGDRELYEALEDLAICHEDLKSTMDYLKVQLDEVRRGVGHHLESVGTVPHTRRGG